MGVSFRWVLREHLDAIDPEGRQKGPRGAMSRDRNRRVVRYDEQSLLELIGRMRPSLGRQRGLPFRASQSSRAHAN